MNPTSLETILTSSCVALVLILRIAVVFRELWLRRSDDPSAQKPQSKAAYAAGGAVGSKGVNQLP